MKLVFVHVGNDSTLPEIMVRSARKAMPGIEVVHLTDEVTPAISNQVVRRPFDGRLMTFRMEHLADLDGEWISLDTDTVVLKDLRAAFDHPFHVALTRRYEPVMMDGVDIAKVMPYNTGVMFSRCQAFWKAARDALSLMPYDTHKWWGDQLAVAHVASRFDVLELPCDEWNWTPKSKDETKDCAVMHFKGPRKDWMLKWH
jgi:hypothetical protein